ncbi:hypothetical protein CEXT_39631 [Caerostris extrusa]|uniref:Uncharacterized protein n=1 Tax=Caerostris extrusa TaxID=172846 RepID=A0AAV4UAB8_CAEEX|nr:hypothetical protein CEXT_39631 [Caerostris extrusa]
MDMKRHFIMDMNRHFVMDRNRHFVMDMKKTFRHGHEQTVRHGNEQTFPHANSAANKKKKNIVVYEKFRALVLNKINFESPEPEFFYNRTNVESNIRLQDLEGK